MFETRVTRMLGIKYPIGAALIKSEKKRTPRNPMAVVKSEKNEGVGAAKRA